MKRALIVAGSVVVIGVIIFATVRAGSSKAETVYAELVRPRKMAIVSGVKRGDQIVTGPFRILKKLHEGDAVEISKEQTKSNSEGD